MTDCKYLNTGYAHKCTVGLSDIDLFMHMSYANYLRLLFQASDGFFLSLTGKEFLKKNRIKANKTSVEFKYQTELGDIIIIYVLLGAMNCDSWELIYKFELEDNNKLIALGRQAFSIDSNHTDGKDALFRRIKEISKGGNAYDL